MTQSLSDRFDAEGKPARIKNLETDKYILFLTSEFSQWYPSEFTSKEQVRFNNAEQYMMYQKAALFGDAETAEKILQATTPKEYKELGRQVKNFDPAVWNAQARDIVYQANYYKFSQNAHLFDVLAATKGKKLVEAADYDKIWGIGLRADDPLARDAANWQGQNWLGETLTKLREDLSAQGFRPASSVSMFKFYDDKGQRTLYIPAQELARQWIDARNERLAASAAKGGKSFVAENPADPVAWAVEGVNELVRFDKGRPYDMHDDPDIDPTMVSATIKGHGPISMPLAGFVKMNSEALYGPRPARPKGPFIS